MKQRDIPTSALEPFNIGRSTFRLFFDFGVMLSCFSSSAANNRVLDFGAGTGWISEFLARLGYEVYAIDIDTEMPASIRSRGLADHRINLANITALIGSGMDLPFPDEFFSHICCFDTLHHMFDYLKTFREMNRVLEPGGRAIFIEPGARHSQSHETIEFIETYKKDDPTWIERDVILDEIVQISKESGFSDVVILPTLLPGLKSYAPSQWREFRQGNFALTQDYLDLLKDFNYNDHLSFYCEKAVISQSTEKHPLTVDDFEEAILNLSGKKIAIDLTPLLPGGANGGAKWLTLELVSSLARLLPGTSFVLLTAQVSHAELDWLERDYSNIERMCVLQNSPQTSPPIPVVASKTPWSKRVVRQLKFLVANILPQEFKQQLKNLPPRFSTWKSRTLEEIEVRVKRVLPMRVRMLVRRFRGVQTVSTDSGSPSVPPSVSVSLLQQLGADLLFCPFTAPFYGDPLIPTVSLVHDLQYRAYPQFFTPQEVIQREDNFRMAYQKAGYLVAVSEFVRQTVIEAANLPPERVIAVPTGLLRPLNHENEVAGHELLQKYGLRRGEFLFYPANFWKHKNHAMLLTAFNLYRRAHPASTLKLVCTGTPGAGAEAFCEAVRRLGLADWVVYPGHVSPEDYSYLLKSAFAVVFPSLYEGFGIPVLEAMSAGVPVLCSNVTSLPEVGGDAVLYFDPRKPTQIVDAVTRLSVESSLRKNLIQKGFKRVSVFAGAERMALQYLDVFAKVLFPSMNERSVLTNEPANGE